MNDRDQLLKLARWHVLFMSLPVLCFIITAFALLVVGNISLRLIHRGVLAFPN